MTTCCLITNNATLSVLAVEDQRANLMILTRILEIQGCRVTVATNGRQALERLQEEKFALVFMDCGMPEMDGFEATRLLRSIETAGEHTIVVALTANSLEGDREQCLAAGMDDYMAKPYDPQRIAEMLIKWSAPS
jgi:CheY-like chemotaxis protein